MSAALTIEGLRVAYRGDFALRPKEVIHDISFSVPKGAFYGFLGHNGAGKTTTIKAMLGLLRPTAGRIRIFGEDPAIPSARRAIGYLPEQPYFYDHLRVQELVRFYAQLAGVARDTLEKAVHRALELVHLTSRANTPMRTLSKGLTQRVGVAQAIVGSPKLLLLDEPFSGLDPIGRRELRELLVQLHREGTTILMSSHMLGDVEFLCDTAAILAHGTLRGVVPLRSSGAGTSNGYELTLNGSPDGIATCARGAIAERKEQNLTRLQFRDQATAEAALRQALDGGVTIHSYERMSQSLEERFVELVSTAGKPQEGT